jgi:hypothetical protein
MDPATERAIEALADAITEFVKACMQMAAAFAVACESLNLAFGTIYANAYAAQVQGRDLNDEWRQVAPVWGVPN